MNVKIRKLNISDLAQFIQLIKIFNEVFDMNNFIVPSEEYLQDLLKDDKVMVFVAIDKDLNVVAGLTAYHLNQYYSIKPLAYIFDLAVKDNFQRMGIGKKLIEFTKAYFTTKAYEEVFVQADRVDKFAVNFYRKTNPTTEEDVQHFYYTL